LIRVAPQVQREIRSAIKNDTTLQAKITARSAPGDGNGPERGTAGAIPIAWRETATFTATPTTGQRTPVVAVDPQSGRHDVRRSAPASG
jgi:hypothetical protein